MVEHARAVRLSNLLSRRWIQQLGDGKHDYVDREVIQKDAMHGVKYLYRGVHARLDYDQQGKVTG